MTAKEVTQAALLVFPNPLSTKDVQPAIALPALVKTTAPEGLLPVTVAVKVTLWFALAGLVELESVVPGGGGEPEGVQASISAT